MDEEENKPNKFIQIFKKSGVKLFKTVLIFAGVLLLISQVYVILKDHMDTASETMASYSTTINSKGELTYIKKYTENGEEKEVEITTEEMAEELEEILHYYIGGDDEEYQETVDYLLGAEATTKLPYMDGYTSGLEGRIKFYRYTGEEQANDAYTDPFIGEEKLKEKYRITYIKPETFEEQLENYKTSGNREVFKHFTMDEDANVVVAYGSVETRNITTQDPDITLELVHENSGESSYTGNYKDGFSMVRYTASTRKIKYLSLVQQYVMPVNLLNSFLIQTRNIDFVMDLAKLAYESEIAIGIYDNETVSTTTANYTYKKMMETEIKTSLDFSGIQTSDPAKNSDDLYNSPFSHIPFMCMATTVEGQISHQLNYYNPSEESQSPTNADYMFITGQTDDGAITGLGEGGKEYTVNYNQQLNATSTPTVGVILADTWIARFKANYEKEDIDPQTSSSGGEQEDIRLIEYSTNEEVLNAFDGGMRSNITSKLNAHASDLKSSAISKIKSKIDFTVPPVDNSITASNVSAATRQSLLQSHINYCSTCSQIVNNWWTSLGNSGNPTAGQVYTEFVKVGGYFSNTTVQTHFNSSLNSHVTNTNKTLKAQAEQEAQEKTIQRENTFTNQLENQIEIIQTLTAGKKYVDINFGSSTTTVTTKYKRSETTERDKEGEKFSDVFNKIKYYDARQAIIKRDAWFWEYIRQNEDTAKLEDVLRYLLNIATDSDMFGTFTEEDIENLFKAFEPKEEKMVSMMGTMSAFGCNLSREEFIQAAQSYKTCALTAIAADFYDVCTLPEYNVNPCLAFGWAVFECGWDITTKGNNLFMIGWYNDADHGAMYSSYKESIEAFCEMVVNMATPGTSMYNTYYNKAQEFAAENSKFEGTPEDNIYALFSAYSHVGDTHTANARALIKRTCDYLYNGINECTHSDSDKTTVKERADYAQYLIDQKIMIAKDVFGARAFVGGAGSYTEASEGDYHGTYVSTSGRTYIEWKQGGDSFSALPMFDAGRTMGSSGCGVYSLTMLLNSVGIDVNPGDGHSAYKASGNCNYTGAMNKIMSQNGVSGTVRTCGSMNGFIAALESGYGAMFHVKPGQYTTVEHWMVAADIRPTELGSGKGYDIYILSSTHRSGAGYGWQPIENISSCINYWGYYIEN